MRGITRRSVLRGGALVGAAAALPALARQGLTPALAVYDSRIAEARAFAADARARGIPVHDIAGEDAMLWTRLRTLKLPPGAVVTGVTGWTDWVALRGLFAAARKRVRDEQRLAHAGTRTATPFAWTMG